MLVAVGSGILNSSGRVIALGRLLLAILFLLALGVDETQPTHAPVTTYGLLGLYVVLASVLLIATWRNWWLDAKLAGPAHGVDIVMFMLLVFLTEGYTSPFFTFFMFSLLSAAIRWGWRATALTALLLTLLYLLAGQLALGPGAVTEAPPFVVRTGHLIILSLILIWFGASRWQAPLLQRGSAIAPPGALDQSPLEAGLRAAMVALRATSGAIAWRDHGQTDFDGWVIRDGEAGRLQLPGFAIDRLLGGSPFLYDLANDRALRKDAERNLVQLRPNALIDPAAASVMGLASGMAIPVSANGGEGEIFLEVPGITTDQIDLGAHIALDVAARIQGSALLQAAQDSAEVRSRLVLARDLHDSVVQFLAGAAFRIEALKRAQASGREIEADLDELKQLMLQEQRELRTFITALRSGPLVELDELNEDLSALAERLSRQWGVRCLFTARPAKLLIPTRLRLDAQQLMREAVANAVRHAQARSIKVGLEAVSDELRLEFVNDGAEYSPPGEEHMPTSLMERVQEAGGMLDMTRGMGVTKVSISLPIGGSKV